MLLLLTLIPLMCTGDSPLSNATTTVTNYKLPPQVITATATASALRPLNHLS